MAQEWSILIETAKDLKNIKNRKKLKTYIFPIEDIISSMRDRKLQLEHDVGEAIVTYGNKYNNPIEDYIWFWFQSPEWTWKNLCGRAGWMVLSKSDLELQDFFLELMN